jgi:hypothetical protein
VNCIPVVNPNACLYEDATQRSNANTNAMQRNAMQRAQLLGKCRVQREWVRGSQRQRKKKEYECVFVSISGSVIPCRTGSLVRSTRCWWGQSTREGSRYGARARDGWHGELGLACAGTLVSGLVAAEPNGEVRRDGTGRDRAALSLGLLCRRDALLYVYMCVCMRAARLLYFCCAAAGASAGVWYGMDRTFCFWFDGVASVCEFVCWTAQPSSV